MAIPLELQLVVSSLGTEVFRGLQEDLMQTGAAARDAAMSGLKVLGEAGLEALDKIGGGDIQLRMGWGCIGYEDNG